MFMGPMLQLLVFMVQGVMVCSGESVRALAGEDVILPCSLGHELDPGGLIVEWLRPDLKPENVHIYREGHDLHDQHPSYKHRTGLFKDELKRGNVSLKLSRVRLEDEGNYSCLTSTADKQTTNKMVQLLVGAGPQCQPEISILGQQKGEVLLQCCSHTWHPHPRLEWLNSEGRVLSAEFTSSQTDGSHSVSSNLTVPRTDSNVTCRVYSEKISHMRETTIRILGDSCVTACHICAAAIVVLCVAIATAITVPVLVKINICCSRKTVSDCKSNEKGDMEMVQSAGEGESNLSKDLTQLRREKNELETTISHLQSDLQQSKTSISQLQSDLQQSKTSISHLQSDLQQSKIAISHLQSDLKQSKITISHLQSDPKDATTKPVSQQEVNNSRPRRRSSLLLKLSPSLPEDGPSTPLLSSDEEERGSILTSLGQS